MMRILVFILGLLVSWSGLAQSRTLSVLINDTCSQYCKPGVQGMTPGRGLAMGVEVLPNLSYTTEQGEINPVEASHRFYGKLRAPLVLQEHFKLLAGLRYSQQEFDFIRKHPANLAPEDLEERSLKSAGASIFGIRALNHNFYLGGRFTLDFNGDYRELVSARGPNSDAMLALLLGLKLDSSLEVGLGLAQGLWNGDYSMIPLLMLNYTKEQFGIEAILPAEAYARYNLNPYRAVYLGVEYFGDEYMLNANYLSNQNTPVLYDHNALRTQASVEQRLFPWVWAELKVGYQWSLNFDILARQGRDRPLVNDVSGSFFGGLELSVRPPSNFGED